MNPFGLMGRYFWAVCLTIGAVNYFAARRSMAAAIPPTDARFSQAQRYLFAVTLAGELPWVFVGYAQLTGAVPSLWYYFRPQDRNPYVLAWFALVIALAVVNAIWILAANGARKVREYELYRAIGLGRRDALSERRIKFYAAAAPFWILLWAYGMSWMDATIPSNAL